MRRVLAPSLLAPSLLAPSLLALCLTGLSAAPALAAPTCVDPLTRALCGGRVVPEASGSVTQHQYDGNLDSLADTLAAIAGEAPAGFVTPMSIGKSAGGRDLWVVRITDPSVPRSEKVQSAISLSVHGLEPAGREGGIRYVEDLALWLKNEPTHPLYAGEVAYPVSEVFKQVELYVGFLNPDGWAKQDLDEGNGSAGATEPRYNGNGADLNRDFPTVGWVDRTGGRGAELDQPESKAWWALLNGLPDLRSAGDIHGELDSTNKAFSDLLWPAGSWSPHHQAKELQLAKDMIRDVERKFADDGVVLGDLLEAAGVQDPANVATGYDAVGYDDSGFMGDAMQRLNGARVVEIDTENFLSHLAPNVVFAYPLEAAHVAVVRGNMEAILTTAIRERSVKAALDLGRVAYVDDPARVTSADGTQFDLVAGEKQTPYDVSPLDYFPVLAADAGTTIAGIASADVATTDLSAFDTVVLTNVEVPKDTKGRPVARAAYVRALKDFMQSGGQLVLTDGAVALADDLGVGSEDDQKLQRTNAGHVDFTDADHPLKAGLYGVPSQTFYEVPLGFPAENQSPHYGIAQTVWEAAGGTTVGTVGASTVLGQMDVGEGRLVVFGAILPTPVESLDSVTTPHPEGLVGYAPTIAGAQVLHNALAYRRAGAPPAVAPPAVTPPTSGPSGGGLAATGGRLVPAVFGAGLMGAVLLRRRQAV